MLIDNRVNILTIPSFGGASANLDGNKGLVPKPVAGEHISFLCGDGSWRVLTSAEVGRTTTMLIGSLGSWIDINFNEVIEDVGDLVGDISSGVPNPISVIRDGTYIVELMGNLVSVGLGVLRTLSSRIVKNGSEVISKEAQIITSVADTGGSFVLSRQINLLKDDTIGAQFKVDIGSINSYVSEVALRVSLKY